MKQRMGMITALVMNGIMKLLELNQVQALWRQANNALDDYGLNDWTLIEGSCAGMMAELKKAYDREKPIIITGWAPHWKFSAYNLKFLEDPKGTFGGAEDIHTIVRKGLDQDTPGAYTILDQFSWEPGDMESVMVDMVADGMDAGEAAEEVDMRKILIK